LSSALLAMLNLPALGLGLVGEPDESAITNPADLRTLEALLTLHLVWAAAAAVAGSGSVQASRAESYRLRAARERSALRARLDLDGDGVPDAERRPGAAVLVRG